MIKYFTILFLLSSCAVVKSQSVPSPFQRSSASVTAVDARWWASLNMKMPRVADTAHGLNGGIDSIGLQIYNDFDQTVYYRDTVLSGGHKWTAYGSGGGSSGVFSFNGRTGIVVPLTGDYDIPKITGLQDSLNTRVDTIFGVNDSTITFTINNIPYNIQIRGGVNGGGAGTGTVTNFSFTNANGLSGSVSNPTSIPDLTISPSFTGLTSSNGSAFLATTIGSGINYSGTTIKADTALLATQYYVNSRTGSGITSLNGLLGTIQTFAVGTSGTNFNISSSGTTHTFNIPTVSGSNTGLVTPTLFNTWQAKQDLLTGAATSIAFANLTPSRALTSDGTGKVSFSSTTSTQLGYLNTATSDIQTQLNAKEAIINYAFTTLTDGATITLNGNSGINFRVTLGGNRTLAVSNITIGKSYIIYVTQDATGNRTLTLPVNSKVPLGFGSGTTINLSTAGDAKDALFMQYDGTNYNFTIAKQFQ